MEMELSFLQIVGIVCIQHEIIWHIMDVYVQLVLVKEYGGEYEEYFIENENIDGNILDDVTMSIKEFREIFDKIGGKVVTNLEDYIRYKYRPA